MVDERGALALRLHWGSCCCEAFLRPEQPLHFHFSLARYLSFNTGLRLVKVRGQFAVV